MEVLSNGTDKVQAQIQDYKEYHTDVTVRFVIHMAPVSCECKFKRLIFLLLLLDDATSDADGLIGIGYR
jgi:hypothetical protein